MTLEGKGPPGASVANVVRPLSDSESGEAELAGPARVAVVAGDPLTRAGLVSYLGSSSHATLARGDFASVDVVVGIEQFTEAAFDVLQETASRTTAPLLLVADEVSGSQFLRALRYRVLAAVARSVGAEALVDAVETMLAGGGFLSAGLLGDLLREVGRHQLEAVFCAKSRSSGFSRTGWTPGGWPRRWTVPSGRSRTWCRM
jgi:hypothetical protein